MPVSSQPDRALLWDGVTCQLRLLQISLQHGCLALARHGREPMGKLYPKASSRDVPRKKPGSRDRDGYKSLGLWSPKQTVGKYDALVQLLGSKKVFLLTLLTL